MQNFIFYDDIWDSYFQLRIGRLQDLGSNPSPPVDLYLNLEKSSWKNQARRFDFLQATQAVQIKFELEKKQV